jgi:hypothetical protein
MGNDIVVGNMGTDHDGFPPKSIIAASRSVKFGSSVNVD